MDVVLSCDSLLSFNVLLFACLLFFVKLSQLKFNAIHVFLILLCGSQAILLHASFVVIYVAIRIVQVVASHDEEAVEDLFELVYFVVTPCVYIFGIIDYLF